MTTIMITRHFSGFTNVADRFQIGNHEQDGDASTTTYTLPEGYEVHQGDIYDAAGYRCEIFPGEHGGPAIFGRYGQREINLSEAVN